MAEHARLGASSAERWLACPGSIRQSEGLPNTTTIYAATGTAAHEVAAICLKEGRQAVEFIDRFIQVDDFRIHVNEEMVDHVQNYIEWIADQLVYGIAGDDEILQFIEYRVSLEPYGPPEPMFGTTDWGALFRPVKTLKVWDLKYGQNIVKEAYDNPQLLYYAAGLLTSPELLNEEIVEIEMGIYQPRAFHPDGPLRRYTISIEELIRWIDDVLIPGARRTQDPDAPLIAGDHCQFCPAIAICEEYRRYALAGAMIEFNDLDAMPTSVPPPPNTLSVHQIAQILEHTEPFMLWLRSVREHAFNLINSGVEIPDWKIVTRKGNRRWTANDPNETAARLIWEYGLPEPELWAPRKLKSPAQIELVVKRNYKKHGAGNAKSVNLQLAHSGAYETPETGTTLARVGDPRPAVIGVTREGFENLDAPTGER